MKMTQKKAVKKKGATKATAKKKASPKRGTKSPRVRSAATNTVPEAVESDEVARCHAAFELGLLANEAAWNFDQAVFGLSRKHRQELNNDLQRLRGVGARLTSMTTDNSLALALNRIEKWIPSLDDEWFSELVEQATGEAIRRVTAQSPNITYHEILQSPVLNIRHELEDPIVNSTLQTPTERLWLRLGVLADSGRHRPDVARFASESNLEIPSVAEAATDDDSAEPSSRILPVDDVRSLRIQWFSGTSQRPVPRFRVFAPGDTLPPIEEHQQGTLPPSDDWQGQALTLLKQIKPKEESDYEAILISDPKSVLEATERLIDTIRKHLTSPASITVNLIQSTITIKRHPYPLASVEAAIYLDTLLGKNDWMSDPEVRRKLAETTDYAAYADTRWTRIRENLPAEIRALL